MNTILALNNALLILPRVLQAGVAVASFLDYIRQLRQTLEDSGQWTEQMNNEWRKALEEGPEQPYEKRDGEVE